MTDYSLYWITENLAVGRAPMSYADLDSLTAQGINMIINLCGEFSDLHELEEQSGFEVCWLPIIDETAPTMEEMERGLEALDEAVYLGKKVLIHCRHGIGRTGTFVTAYLLRRGFSLKMAGKMLKKSRAHPSNFSQWWLLRKFGKKQGQLLVEEPTTSNRCNLDLECFFLRYELLLNTIEHAFPETANHCSSGNCNGCAATTKMQFIEALYLHTRANVHLNSAERRKIIGLAVNSSRLENETTSGFPMPSGECPLREGANCLLHRYRPVDCRLRHQRISVEDRNMIDNELRTLSKEVFAAVFGTPPDTTPLSVTMGDVMSGRFIQWYFQHLLRQHKTLP